MRQILVKVWQGLLTPRRALRDLRRVGAVFGLDKERVVIEILTALKDQEIRVNEAEEALTEEGVRYDERENLCQA